MARIVDSVFVDDDRADQSTELDQRMPVTAVAGETGDFDREHSPRAPIADRGQEAFEAGAHDAATRASEIIVDHFDRRPAKFSRTIREAVLTALAFQIVHQLIGGRLADVDIGTPREML